ncbi:hypothetical protein ES705_37640 [subsurface metagenome]
MIPGKKDSPIIWSCAGRREIPEEIVRVKSGGGRRRAPSRRRERRSKSPGEAGGGTPSDLKEGRHKKRGDRKTIEDSKRAVLTGTGPPVEGPGERKRRLEGTPQERTTGARA